MSALMNEDCRAFQRLNKQFPLRPIRDDDQNDCAAEVCDRLLDRIDSLNQGERDYLEVLTDLIAKYEQKWKNEVSRMAPRDLIKYLMEQNGLAQRDLVSEFGSASRVSEFLKGERELSVQQAKRLAHRFSLDVAALI